MDDSYPEHAPGSGPNWRLIGSVWTLVAASIYRSTIVFNGPDVYCICLRFLESKDPCRFRTRRPSAFARHDTRGPDRCVARTAGVEPACVPLAFSGFVTQRHTCVFKCEHVVEIGVAQCLSPIEEGDTRVELVITDIIRLAKTSSVA